MSFVQPEALQAIADSVCIPKLSTDAAKVLAPDIEYRLREIIQEAVKFKRHSKRAVLTTDDISQALRLRNVQPAYGFATSTKDAARFLRAAGHSDLWFLEDRDAPFDQVIGKSLPRPPIEVGLLPHWLIVDGVQPTIPENAPLERPRARKRARASIGGVPPAAAAAPPAAAPATSPPKAAAGVEQEQLDSSVVRAPVKHVVSQELQLYFDTVSELLLHGGAAAEASTAAPAVAAVAAAAPQQPTGPVGAAAGAAAGRTVAGSAAEQLERAVLASLSTDPGLAPLVPYLVQLVGEGVANGLRDLPRLQRLLAAAAAMLANPHMGLAPYLHQLLPPVLTCLVARRLGDAAGSDHWEVRDAAARLVRSICTAFADPLYNIQPRISRTLLKALLDRSKPLTTHYGAIVGLAVLGPRTVRLLLLPHLVPYLEQLQPLLGSQDARSDSMKPKNQLKRAEALRCYGALQAAAAAAVYTGLSQRLVDLLLTAPRTAAKKQRLEKKAVASADAAAQPAAEQRADATAKVAEEAGQRSAAGEQAPDNTTAVDTAGADGEQGVAASAASDAEAARLLSKAAEKGPEAAYRAKKGVVPAGAEGGAQERSSMQPLDRRKAAPQERSANALADAWKEASDLGAQLQAVAELFGESVLPWVPFQRIGDVLL